jgi:hypothetical protein
MCAKKWEQHALEEACAASMQFVAADSIPHLHPNLHPNPPLSPAPALAPAHNQEISAACPRFSCRDTWTRTRNPVQVQDDGKKKEEEEDEEKPTQL